MSALLLVRHAPAEPQRGRPQTEWKLSDGGRARCVWLGEQLRAHNVRRLFASDEPKAFETARLAGAVLGVEAAPRINLHEHDRSDAEMLDGAEFRVRMRDFFANPTRFVIGCETADAACARFSAAVGHALAEARGATTAIVAHGAVITLFVAQHNQIPAPIFWEHLGQPSFLTLDSETFRFDGKIHNCPM